MPVYPGAQRTQFDPLYSIKTKKTESQIPLEPTVPGLKVSRLVPTNPAPPNPFRRPNDRGLRAHRRSAEQSMASRRVVERSEEHTSELQSPCNLVCSFLLEKTHTRSAAPRPATICTSASFCLRRSEHL